MIGGQTAYLVPASERATMRICSTCFWALMLAVLSCLGSVACHKTQARNTHAPPTASTTGAVEETPVRDAAWHQRAAVVSVDPGNAVSKRRSESTFSTRTSHASVDSRTSSLLVQVAALKHSVALKPPRLEQQLRDMGLQVVGQRRSKLHHPNDYNVLVEDVTYVEESERKNAWGPVVYTLVPAIHVRVISANERASLEGIPIAVKVHGGTLSPEAADVYGSKLAAARADLGKQLVQWLESRLQVPAASETAAPTAHIANANPLPQVIGHNATAKK